MADYSKARWHKASWHTSTYSGGNGCVEVAFADGQVGVRDSKQQGQGPVLEFTLDEWKAFLAGARVGQFDLVPEL